jgi:hypothetical protein
MLAKIGMLQLYTPYKNLVPRFLGNTREKGTRVTPIFNDLVDLAMIFFLEEVDLRHHEASFPSFDNVTQLH